MTKLKCPECGEELENKQSAKLKITLFTEQENIILDKLEEIQEFLSRRKKDYSKKYLNGEIGMIFGKKVIIK